MKKRLTRIFCISAVIFTMTLSIASCNNSEPTNSTNTTEKTTESQASSEIETKVTEAEIDAKDKEYIASVQKIYDDIQVVGGEYANVINSIDLSAPDGTVIIEATKTMVEKSKPLYESLTKITATDKYKDAQEKINSGAQATVKMLEKTLEITNLSYSGDTDSDKATQLESEAMSYVEEANKLAEGWSMLGIGVNTGETANTPSN